MPVCPLCPGRYFKDDNGLKMVSTLFPRKLMMLTRPPTLYQHRESKVHPRSGHSCGTCGKVFASQQALDQHSGDKHSNSFECQYCDRMFTTAQGRDAHEEAQHPTFECHYCDCEFGTEKAREQHEEAKHPTSFECHYCYSKFGSEEARGQHEDAKHGAIECLHCDRKFSSEDARQQHESAKHPFECNLGSRTFTRVEALRQHEQTTPHIECSYCTGKFLTTALKKAHEISCYLNPANRVTHLTSRTSGGFTLPRDRPKSTEVDEEEWSTSDDTQSTDDESESPTSPRSAHSTLDEEREMFHSTSSLLSTGANGGGATAPQPCACTRSLEPGTCSICQQSSSLSSNTDKSVPVGAESVVSADEGHQDGSRGHRDVTFQCTHCFKLFGTEEVYQDHVCAFRTTMFRPHCPVCYTQFDDEPTLQKHLEGLQLFSCLLCLTRCCSDEMLQDHILSHPTCGRCGMSFVDNLVLCVHVESDHAVVVCWDCDGIVVERNSLELHYAGSPAHATCGFCGVGKRNSADMDEHVRHVHAASAELKDHGNMNASPDAESTLVDMQPPGADQGGGPRQPLEEVDHLPLSSIVDVSGTLVEPGDEHHRSPLQTESSLFSLPQLPMPPQVEPVDEAAGSPSVTNGKEESRDGGVRQYASPSPTASERDSDASQLQSLASKVTNTATNNDTRPPSTVSSVSTGSFSDPSTRNSLTTSSSQSVVFVSADSIPDYIRENRAVLVATSAGSPSSCHTPLRLSSSSSLESLGMERSSTHEAGVPSSTEDAAAPRTGSVTYRLHCRICLRDPCEDMTATICGHLFCKRCITQAVVAKSECPVCKSATLLYCLFKLDLSV
ncbi:hypothetical protein HD554DRAFT_2132277 [Boletus coccyginus]|nr:hypothetical protein HD554DRAFT_2132277 [Boletus coccyginus]